MDKKVEPVRVSEEFKKKDVFKFYLLDSSNSQHWFYEDDMVPEKYLQRLRDHAKVGLLPTNKFTQTMIIQSMFDARRSLVILQDVFVHKTSLIKYYTQA